MFQHQKIYNVAKLKYIIAGKRGKMEGCTKGCYVILERLYCLRLSCNKLKYVF